MTCVQWGGEGLIYTSSQDRTVKVWRDRDVSVCICVCMFVRMCVCALACVCSVCMCRVCVHVLIIHTHITELTYFPFRREYYVGHYQDMVTIRTWSLSGHGHYQDVVTGLVVYM